MRRTAPTPPGGGRGRWPVLCVALLMVALFGSVMTAVRDRALGLDDGSGFTSQQLEQLSDRGLDALTDDTAALSDICRRRGTPVPAKSCPPCSTSAPCGTQLPCPTAAAGAAVEHQAGSDGQSPGGSRSISDDMYLAMCLVVKDARLDIREWVGHHKFIGAGKAYIYDTGSIPPLNESLADYIASGFVGYTWLVPDFGTPEKKKRPQMDLWNECIADHRSKHQFMAFLDTDEFIMMGPGYRTLPQLLKQMQAFEPIGALVSNWRMFGSSGHKTRPNAPVLKAYTKCEELVNQHGIHVKTIANMGSVLGLALSNAERNRLSCCAADFVKMPLSPHHFAFTDGKYAVDSRFQRIDGPVNRNVTADKVIVNHYFTKSLQEWNEKATRGTAMGLHKPFKYFEDVDENSVLDCLEATGLGPYP